MSSTTFNDKPFVVQSPDVTYTEDEMVSKYTYQVCHSCHSLALATAGNLFRVCFLLFVFLKSTVRRPPD